MDVAELVRGLRNRHGLSQAGLAYRAGTTQQAISRIEQGGVSPTVEMLERLATACGEQLVLGAKARRVAFEEAQLEGRAARPMSDRLTLSLSWNELATEIAGKARGALEDG